MSRSTWTVPPTLIHDASAIPQDLAGVMLAVLEHVEKFENSGREDRRFKVKGDVLMASGLGQAVRLEWLAFISLCEPECWALHCPTPETHIRHFGLTMSGRSAAEALRDKTPASPLVMR